MFVHRLEGPKKPLAATHTLAGCVFADPELMPWLPKSAGQHGFGFIDRWTDLKELNETKPLRCALFMAVDAKKEKWRYFGQYMLERMTPVSRHLWEQFPDDVSAFTLIRRTVTNASAVVYGHNIVED